MKAQGTITCVLAAALAACLPAFAMAQASSPTLEQRLQRVEDELAIRRVLVDYSATQDARDHAGYAALFAWNGEPTPSLAGRYEDEFIREEGKWKILRRVDYPVMPTSEEWMKFIRERRAAQ
jgi:hypothetical protein